jgi:hypothetical protein
MKPSVLHALSSKIAYGLHEFLRTDAANIHQSTDWFILFSLLEVVGGGAQPPPFFQPTSSQHLVMNKPIHHRHPNTNVDWDSKCSDCVANRSLDKVYQWFRGRSVADFYLMWNLFVFEGLSST